MWRECSPGGRFLISIVIFAPLGADERVAVPTLWPCTFLMSTVRGFAAACARASRADTRPAADKNSAAQTNGLIMILLKGELYPRIWILSENVPSQSSARTQQM